MDSLIERAARTEVRVLEFDPDLAAGLGEAETRLVTHRACARLETLEAGAQQSVGDGCDPYTTIGLLVMDGLLIRTLAIGDRRSTELIGVGDLLRPWQHDGQDGMVPCRVDWRVLERTRVAVLDAQFAASIARFPQVSSALVGRALRRSRWQAVATTLSHMTRVDQRLLMLFWHFAERWGRVRPDGVIVRLPLTHETLGALIGARRPSVTSGLSALARKGLVKPADRGAWLLTEAAREWIDAVAEAADDGGEVVNGGFGRGPAPLVA
jgi:hypothetical protein